MDYYITTAILQHIDLVSEEAEKKMLKNSLRISIVAWEVIVQIFYGSRRICGLLLSSLPFLILVSYGIHPIAQNAHGDLSRFDNSSNMYTPIILENIFGLLKGNLPNPLEHMIDIDAKHIFPNETLKREMINKSGPSEFTMPYLKYNLLGFNISATDIEVKTSVKQVSDDSDQNKKTRIDFPVMLARNVDVSNKVTSQRYHNMDLSSIYAIYDSKTDKFTFHVPFNIAAKYLLKGS